MSELVFLVSTLILKAKLRMSAAKHARSGHHSKSAMLDAQAQILELVESELRSGVPGDVEVAAVAESSIAAG